MVMTLTRSLESISIRESNQPNDVIFRFDWPFQNQDKIYFSSEENNRYLYLTRGVNFFNPAGPILNSWNPTLQTFTIRHLTDRISSGSVWPVTRPGTNLIYLTQGVVVNNIQFQHAYWGV
jgi:hypothetical protein